MPLIPTPYGAAWSIGSPEDEAVKAELARRFRAMQAPGSPLSGAPPGVPRYGSPEEVGPTPPLPVPPVPPVPPMQEAMQPPTAPSPPPRASGSGGPVDPNRWATAQAPPPEYADFVASAAQRHGVPLPIMHWLGFHESGWRPDATGIETSTGRARGMFQFMPGTARELGIDPLNPAQAADGAARYLAQHYARTGDWVEAMRRYGTLSTGRGADADKAVEAGFRQYLTGVGSLTPPAPGPAQASGGANDFEKMILEAMQRRDRANNEAIQMAAGAAKPTPADAMMAMAAGLLQGPTFGAGLGKGFDNLRQVNTQGRDGVLRAAQLRSALGNSGVQSLIGLAGLDVRRQALSETSRRNDIMQQGANTSDNRLAFKTSGQEADERARAQVVQKWHKDFDEAMKGTSNLLEAKRDIANLRTLVQSDPNLVGSTVKNRVVRFLTEHLGIGADPNTLSLMEKDFTKLQTDAAKAAFGGTIGGRVALGEFNQIIKGAAGLQSNPAAVQVLLDSTDQMLDHQLEARTTLQQALKDSKGNLDAAVRGLGGVNGFLHDTHMEIAKRYRGVGAPSDRLPATIQQPPGQSWQTTEPTTGMGYTRIR